MRTAGLAAVLDRVAEFEDFLQLLQQARLFPAQGPRQGAQGAAHGLIAVLLGVFGLLIKALLQHGKALARLGRQ